MRGGKRELRLTGGDDPKFRAMVRKLDQSMWTGLERPPSSTGPTIPWRRSRRPVC